MKLLLQISFCATLIVVFTAGGCFEYNRDSSKKVSAGGGGVASLQEGSNDNGEFRGHDGDSDDVAESTTVSTNIAGFVFQVTEEEAKVLNAADSKSYTAEELDELAPKFE